ncbi:MAG: glucosidase [Chloroflexota bacterium]|nr:glucosidase [Chloroflexota bacterium]
MAERDESPHVTPTIEHLRLAGDETSVAGWRRWGPYVSDRSWGTVREDYSANGDAWGFLTHDQARSKAYRWGEDAITGICDRYQILAFAPAFWNGVDPILKERLFGLTPHEGNHGEDVKEYYFYLDNLPSHAYMRCLYKYPQARFPYQQLVDENRRRNGAGPEYELLDTGVFDEDRYFDIVIEYAKASEEDIVVRIEAFNRGTYEAVLHLIPQLWFRNRWAWDGGSHPLPSIVEQTQAAGPVVLIADDSPSEPLPNLGFIYRLGERYLYGEPGGIPLFTDNETNGPAVFGPGATSRSRFTKDAFHRFIVDGEQAAVNRAASGTKACVHYTRVIAGGGSTVLRLRLTNHSIDDPLGIVDRIISQRRSEADEFYDAIQPPKASDDERLVQRQAFAGMLWSKQIYLFDVNQWLDGDNADWPPPGSHASIRNRHWRHLNSMRILSMPDAWEYPWFAAWDLAFHAVTLALVDPLFAKEQLWLMLFEQFQHPNGQLPAYEWEFSDTNPPVHAWAVWRVYNMDRIRTGVADRTFLERCFHKLLLNFTWWVNKVDRAGNNVFEGGFLGLDNITVLDRSEPLPEGAILEEADATGWMGMYCLNLMRIALELAHDNPVYEGLAVKFFEHYVYIGAAMKQMARGGQPLWNAEDGFFYDMLRHADGRVDYFRVRSLVGLIPLYAVERLERDWIEPFDEFRESFDWFLKNRKDLVEECVATVTHADHGHDVHVLSIVNQEQMRGLLARIWHPNEFLSPYGMRSLSKTHERDPFVFGNRVVRYEPADAVSKIKGGNSNWRGPIWFPTTFMMIEALRKLAKAHGADFDLGLADDDGSPVTFGHISRGLADRLISIFTADEQGRRPVHGRFETFQNDPHWRDLILFYEFFDGDTGAGLGASHQTGWTGLVASLIDEWRR